MSDFTTLKKKKKSCYYNSNECLRNCPITAVSFSLRIYAKTFGITGIYNNFYVK